MDVFLSIDPGQSTGLAAWKGDTFLKDRKPPFHTDLLTVASKERKLHWHARCEIIARQLDKKFYYGNGWQVKEIWCELPAFFESAGGMMVATKGDLIKLTFLTGMFAGIAKLNRCRFHVVPVSAWKGQLPKEITRNRIQKLLGTKACTWKDHNVWDAVGIGLWAKGIFK